MWPFRKKGEIETRISRLDSALENSFEKVRQDMASVSGWIRYLYSQDAERQKLIGIIHAQMEHLAKAQSQQGQLQLPDMSHITRKLSDFEQKIDTIGVSVKTIEPIIDKVAVLNSQVRMMEETQKTVFDKLREFAGKLEEMPASRVISHASAHSPGMSNLKEKIIRKVARHSKDYIKNLILSTIARYDELSALHLREMIVEEQGLCSKSTFYRLLEELEAADAVSMIARGKEKVYLPKAVQKHAVRTV